MKKRFPAFLLALVLCMGLAVPAFAASETASGAPKINVNFALPGGGKPEASSGTYQLRRVDSMALRDKTTDTIMAYVIARDEKPTSYPLTTYALPLGTTLTISNLQNDWTKNDGQVDVVAIQGYSDPDGDGIYDQWIYDFTSDSPVVPLTEDNVTYLPAENGRYSYDAYLTGDNKIEFALESLPDTVTITTDFLNEMFGPNTLVLFNMQVWTALSTDPLTAFPTDSNGGIICLITGEEKADTPAEPSEPAAPAFTDVPTGEWYAAPVAWAVEEKITNGTSDTKFSPGQNCTQAQILTFLYRADRGQGPASAADMDLAVEWAKEKGIIDGTFEGSTPCTRATAVSYIWQALGKSSAKASSFTDVPADADYADAVSWAVENGITNGDGSETIFSPDKVCSRGHIVTFLHRAYVEEARLTVK